jgi:hypothetical protein
MKRLALVCGMTTLLGAVQPAPPARPVAEGFGAATPGGRDGRRIAVTSLADAGPGSLRAALATRGPRQVVFEVAGLVTLATPITVDEPYLTLDGSSAPGDGICVRGSGLVIRTHDVIVRHMRFRPGDINGAEVDALNVAGDSHHVLIDHVSASWAVDENLSASGAIHDVTIQWSLIAEGLNNSVHAKGSHGYGSLVRAVGGVTLHHNLWAHNDSRNPRIGDNYGAGPWPTFDVRNNVIYDYGSVAHGMVGDRLSANFIGNYIRPGPSSDAKKAPIALTDTAAVEYYVAGNFVEGRAAGADVTLFNLAPRVTLAKAPFASPPVQTSSAATAFEEVLAGAGATLPHRDSVDARIVREVRERTGKIIDSQKQVGGWPEYVARR